MSVRTDQEVGGNGRSLARRRRLLWWGRAIVTISLAAALTWQLRDEVTAVQLHLKRPELLVGALGFALAGVVLSVILWRLMLAPGTDAPLRPLVAYYLSGMFWNHFLPGGVGGDAVRAGALWHSGRRAEEAFNSVLMARVAGLWSIVFLASVGSLTYWVSTEWHQALPFLLLAAGATAATAVGTAFVFGAPLAWLLGHLPDGWRRWHAELVAYRSRSGVLIRGLVCSVFIQFCAVGVNLLVARALDISVASASLMLAIPLVSLIAALPISLGGFGIREGAYLWLLGHMGVASTDAVVLSLAVYTLLALVAALGATLTRPWAVRTGRNDACES